MTEVSIRRADFMMVLAYASDLTRRTKSSNVDSVSAEIFDVDKPALTKPSYTSKP